MMSTISSTLLLLSLVGSQQARTPFEKQNSLEVKFAGQELNLVLPEDMCFFDEAYEYERETLELQRTTDNKHETFAGFAPCEMLERFRAGQMPQLGKYGFIKSMRVSAEVRQKIATLNRGAFVAQMADKWRSQSQSFGPAKSDINTRLKEVDADRTLVGTRLMGVTYEDSDKFGVLMFGRVQIEDATHDRLTVMGTTLMRGLHIAHAMSVEYEGPQSAAPLTEESRAALSLLIAANP